MGRKRIYYERVGEQSISVKGRHISLGSHHTEEAYQVYKKAKEDYIKSVAGKYRGAYYDFPKKIYDAMYSYEVIPDD